MMRISVTATARGSRFAPILLIGDLEAQIRQASQLGFAGIELHIRDPRLVQADVLRQTAEETGVRITAIGTGQAYVDEGLSLTTTDSAIYRRAVDRVRDQIDLGRILGAKVIIGTIRGLLPVSPDEAARAHNQVVGALRDCARYAADQGVILTLEAINRYESNFLNTAAETLALIDEIGEASVGLHLDTFHMNIEEISMAEAIFRASRRLVHLHCADSNRRAPGWGHLDFGAIVRSLEEVGYRGDLTLECLPLPDSTSAATQGRNYLNALIGRQ